MPLPHHSAGASRRALLLTAALLPLAGCDTADRRPASAGSGAPGSSPPSSSSAPSNSPPPTARFAALERAYGARLGIYALATDTGATVTHRPDERFAFCSTFKALAAAAVLHRTPVTHLDRRITYTQADLDSTAPITKDHVGTGMTLRQLCDAAIRYSDGTAANLLMRDLGGPARLTAYLRELGDRVSRMDDYEPELHDVPPGDPRDTTTPRAIAADFRELVLGDALPARERALLTDWLERNRTAVAATRIRAGLPKRWRVADKTGTGNWGRANHVAVVWPRRAAPLVVAVLSERPGYESEPRDALLAAAAREVVAVLT
ncbi:class A beta-lactamase BlaC [Streptomyces deserti]